MQTVIETPEYLRCVKKLDLSKDEREFIVDMIASHPETGDEISGTGGMRKVRVATKGKGKSGGYRLITFFSGNDIPVFLVTIYSKSDKGNITEKEKNMMKTLSNAVVETYRRKRK